MWKNQNEQILNMFEPYAYDISLKSMIFPSQGDVLVN